MKAGGGSGLQVEQEEQSGATVILGGILACWWPRRQPDAISVRDSEQTGGQVIESAWGGSEGEQAKLSGQVKVSRQDWG